MEVEEAEEEGAWETVRTLLQQGQTVLRGSGLVWVEEGVWEHGDRGGRIGDLQRSILAAMFLECVYLCWVVQVI